ncbi:pre-rRNA processing protein [Aspergillus arachidicola]|uniref:Pre-rRNA processing protein n=1 Tax=Aspergillus arachidicola TaxID=656916 RepID=A0A2G7G8L6_9EURO|nr:pre-rRNA processing protein [Aspergillus arachidicola]
MSQQLPQENQPNSASSYLDLGITLAIHNWPALTLAVQSNWGGPTSSDKRDWLCGAISDMLNDRPETDAEDLEDVLIQVMNDEFDVVIDDESAVPVAEEIMEVRGLVAKGDFGPIKQMWENYQTKSQQKASNVAAAFKRGEDEDQDSDDDDDDDEEEDEEDVDMGEAPALVRAPKEKVEPEVDEDGFTKVVGKKKR